MTRQSPRQTRVTIQDIHLVYYHVLQPINILKLINSKLNVSQMQVVNALPQNPDPDTFYFIKE